MDRRLFLAACALLAGGCGGTTRRKSKAPSGGRARLSKGPQTMGNVLVNAYIDDLKSPSAEKKIGAAAELGNMGSGATAALPALEKLVGDKNPKVSAAAKAAVAAIRKK